MKKMSNLEVINITSVPLMGRNEKHAKVAFFVRPCGDVLLEILHQGNRRQLVKLEPIGRRIHLLVENFLDVKPFLRLDIRITPCPRDQEVYISGNNRHLWISLTDLPTLPSFLRFDNVQLWYDSSSAPISEKCEVAESHLRSFKHALNDTNMLEFCARINDSNDYFRDHLLLLDHLRDRVLPICDSSRCYKFEISFYLEEDAITNLIASILQQSAINLCTNVCIRIHHGFGQQQLFLPSLPIEEISNWLHQMSDHGKELIQAEKFLDVKMLEIQNVAEMVEYLKMKFDEAKFPRQTYTLRCWYRKTIGVEIVEQTLSNKAGEEFSVHFRKDDIATLVDVIEIKRNPKKKKLSVG